MGIKGSTTGEVFFEDCRVLAANRIGEEGDGFKVAMRVLDRSRPGIAAQALGIAQGATDYALEYAKTRETMGKPIAEHQLIAGKLAEMETKCEAARGLLYKVGLAIDEGVEPLTKLSAMTKLFCGDTAMEVTTEAVQILGGYGYMKEYPVERMMRDAKITQIYEGTQEIQRLVIAREMVRGAGLAPRRRRLAGGSGGAHGRLVGALLRLVVLERFVGIDVAERGVRRGDVLPARRPHAERLPRIASSDRAFIGPIPGSPSRRRSRSSPLSASSQTRSACPP